MRDAKARPVAKSPSCPALQRGGSQKRNDQKKLKSQEVEGETTTNGVSDELEKNKLTYFMKQFQPLMPKKPALRARNIKRVNGSRERYILSIIYVFVVIQPAL